MESFALRDTGILLPGQVVDADAEVKYSRMNTVPIRRIHKQYINFHLRKLINRFIMEQAEVMVNMDVYERAKFVAEGIEQIVCTNYWIKDKRRVIQFNQSKAA